MRVLIAHRSESLRRQAWAVLDRMGCDVVEADDAVDAVRLCQGELPDVALIEADLAWPGGGSLIEHFRADERLRDARVILFEEELEFDAAFEGIEAGVDEYLVGPVSFPEVAVRVNTADRLRQLEARLDDQRAELRELIHTDPLTRLFNRRYLQRQIGAQINTARRNGRPLSILLVDLDNFKTVNDTRGHAAGDEALKAVAGLFASRLRDTDVPGRWGGDEFLVLLPGTEPEAAAEVARQLCAAGGRLAGFPELTLSIGCAGWVDEGPTELVARADRALYGAKAAGRNGVVTAPDPVVAINVPRPVAPGGGGPPLRVLLVDDVDGIRSLLRLTLEGPAIEIVGEAEDGEQALQRAAELAPDVVVMDWNMPGMDGLEATRALAERQPDVTVVAFTSTDDRRIVRALLDAGAAAQFDKSALPQLAAFLAELHARR